jgi:hypothetical protein
MMNMKTTVYIILFLAILSCGNKNNDLQQNPCGEEPMPKYDYRATVQGEMTPQMDSILRIEKRRDVFKPCRTIHYRAKFYSEDQELLSNETITVKSTGKRWEHQTEKQDEVIITYDYNRDSIEYVNSYQLNKAWINPNWQHQEITGVIENVEKIWTHPFRSNQYNFTQVAPFPQMELPLRIGKKWTDNNISLRDGFGDWANMKVKSEFEIIEQSNIKTEYGEFENSWKVKAVSTFPLGESELIYWFNEQYGFVKLDYTNYGKQRLNIEVTNINDTAGNK